LLVELRLDSPLLRDALGRAPDVSISHEEQYLTDDGINYLFWAETDGGEDGDSDGDLSVFEAGLDADRTVRNVAQLADTEGGRLYRVTFTDHGEQFATFPVWGELDISILDSTGTHEGWEVRMRMPDRDALREFRSVCADRDVPLELVSIYEERDGGAPSPGLTDEQREALRVARELGYFEVPRQTSMTDISNQLGISSQAVSERIRRGTDSLVEESLPSQGE
jgi:predicted DNA binding protein